MGNAMTFKVEISLETLDRLAEELQDYRVCDAHLHDFNEVRTALDAFLHARVRDWLDDIERAVKQNPDDFADVLPDLPNRAYKYHVADEENPTDDNENLAYDENAEHLREYYRNLGVPTQRDTRMFDWEF